MFEADGCVGPILEFGAINAARYSGVLGGIHVTASTHVSLTGGEWCFAVHRRADFAALVVDRIRRRVF
jgi:hypothetical protein